MADKENKVESVSDLLKKINVKEKDSNVGNANIHDELLEPIDASSTERKGKFNVVNNKDFFNVAREAASYSPSEIDNLRKVLSKSDISLVNSEQTNFLNRAIENGLSEDDAISAFENLREFKKLGEYAFNKSKTKGFKSPKR